MRRERIKRHSGVRYYLLNILLFIIILGIITAAAIIFFCQTSSVKVKGNTIGSDKEIEQYVLSDKYDENAVYATVRNFLFPRKDIPFVASYRVSMQSRNTLVIKVTEKEPYGFVESEKGDAYVYYGKDGNVLEVSDRLLEDVFRVVGLTAKEPKVGERLPVGESNVKTILTIQEEINREELEVAAITFSKDGTITFSTGNILVNLGTRANIAEKLRRLPYILPKLKKQRGILHLEEWSEENTDIVFEKEE